MHHITMFMKCFYLLDVHRDWMRMIHEYNGNEVTGRYELLGVGRTHIRDARMSSMP